MAQWTQLGHVELGQFTWSPFYWVGLVLKAVNQNCAHSFPRNLQMPFLNQWRGENDCRKYFMIKSPRKNVSKKGYLVNVLFLHKNMCCGYSFEMPWQVTSISTHNMFYCRYKKTTVNPRYNDIVCSQRYCLQNEFAVVKISKWAEWYITNAMFYSYFFLGHMFWIFVRIASVRQF